MALSFYINGPAKASVAAGDLGYSTPEGVSVRVIKTQKELFSDQRGPGVAGEVVRQGQYAEVRLQLVEFDAAKVRGVIATAHGGTEGSLGTIGELMFANNRSEVLTISSPTAGKPYVFNRAVLAGDEEFSLNSEETVYNLLFKCYPDANGVIYT